MLTVNGLPEICLCLSDIPALLVTNPVAISAVADAGPDATVKALTEMVSTTYIPQAEAAFQKSHLARFSKPRTTNHALSLIMLNICALSGRSCH